MFYFYYFLLIIFCLAFQWKYNISLGNVSIYTLLVQPFTTGEMGFMMGPAWFLLSLFLVQFLFVLIFPIIRIFFKNIYLQFCFFFSLSLISVILNNRTVNINEFVLMMYRTLIGLFFYFLGFFYKNKIENKVNIFNGSILFFCLFIISFLTAKFYPATLFDMRQGIYHNHIFLFFITSLIGIYISIFISKGLDKILKKNDFLHLVGKNSFYIMIFHFFVNFFVSFILLKVNFVNPNEWGPILVNSGIRPYEINNLWFVYISLGIILPTLYGLLIEKLKTRINENQSFAIK